MKHLQEREGKTYLVDPGAFGENIAGSILKENGWTDFTYIKNASDNGIDIIARGDKGQLGFFEVKTSSIGKIQDLTDRQGNMDFFVNDVLTNAKDKTGAYTNIDSSISQKANDIYNEFISNPNNVSGTVFGIDVKDGEVYVSRWER